jgi:hypothetical protein
VTTRSAPGARETAILIAEIVRRTFATVAFVQSDKRFRFARESRHCRGIPLLCARPLSTYAVAVSTLFRVAGLALDLIGAFFVAIGFFARSCRLLPGYARDRLPARQHAAGRRAAALARARRLLDRGFA